MRNLLVLIPIVLSLSCGPDAGSDIDANNSVVEIDEDGDGFNSEVDCDDNDPSINPGATEVCDDGKDNDCDGDSDTDFECLSPCEQAVEENSYLGCAFFALDLPQFSLNKIFAISISNPSTSETANVEIFGPDGLIDSFTVAPLGVGTYEDSTRTMNVASGGVTDKSYRIKSDRPVAAYQFNSFDTIGAASTDASLLFADHTFGADYFSMNYSVGVSGDFSYIAVVAKDDNTTVNVTPSTTTDDATTATLNSGEVFLVTANENGTTLTGSAINASKPVAVFSGNRCGNVPTGTSFCDHMEQQIFPRQAIGSDYLIPKSHARQNCNVDDHIRILADSDNTTIALTPALAGPFTLQAGEFVEFTMSESVALKASAPVLVGLFLRSSGDQECASEGDPAFILQVPSDQFRDRYVFLTPPTYTRDYVDVVAPLGANVLIDGQAITLNTTLIGNTQLTHTSVEIPDGSHTLQADMPVGISVYGYGGPGGSPGGVVNVSYGYPGGLDLRIINPID